MPSSSIAASSIGRVEGAADDVELLFARQPDEVHRIAGDADSKLRILLRMLHRFLQSLLRENVEVHVKAALAEIHVEGLHGIVQRTLRILLRDARRDRDGEADAVLRIGIRQPRDGEAGGEPAMTVAAMHRIGAGAEWLALAAT